MMRTWIKPTAAGLAALTVIALLAFALRPKPVEVETAPVIRGAFEQAVEEDGQTRVRDRYVVSAPLAGYLLRIQHEAGDSVKRGGLLAMMIPAAPALLDVRMERELQERLGAAEAEQMRARASAARTQAALDQARADLERSRQLAQEGLISPAQHEQQELTVTLRTREREAARFEAHVAEHQVDLARAALTRAKKGTGGAGERLEIRSPVNGQVLRVLQESEGVVALGTPLMEIADPADLEVVVDVLTTDAVQMKPGMPVRIVRYGAGAPLSGRVRLIEPSAFTKVSALGVEEQRVNAVVDFVSLQEEWRVLGDGYRVEAQIITYQNKDAIQVPVGALFREGDRWAVFLAEGRARKRIVQVGRRNKTEAMIETGLAPGQQVIVYPTDAVRDGVRIRPR